ncbi:kinase-like domain-containing protein [Infundibulicybe gibba]|nr:kinase-like domain-containing protein [Infundibulicybe gibba]
MATLFSQHSSNPLEAGSSDVRNNIYNLKYLSAEALAAEHNASSDDPIQSYTIPELEQYHQHLSHILPNHPMNGATSAPSKNPLVDLDADMSDEEAAVIPVAGNDLEEDEDEEALFEDDDEELGDVDAQGETDEEMTIHLKSPDERQEIEEEIASLEEAVPQLTSDYKIVDRLAIDLWYHDKWDNTPWHGYHPPSSSAYYQSMPRPRGAKVFVAIKRIYVTSSPERIRNEISIMEDCRGCRHISQLITAFRHYDQVVAIMPYHRNEDFRDFYRTLPIEGIKTYFRCMFRALRDIHTRAIIHRDVKPANFLFDPRTGIGTLCDSASRRSSHAGACLHSSPTSDHPHGRIKSRNEFNVDQVKAMQKEARLKSTLPSEKVGYPTRTHGEPISKANRAGTRGFRAPEVLLKCGDQTGAIDVWATGMILLFFLTGKFPLFQSNDDIEALMEIATIIGRRKMEKTATLHSRTFSTNVPSISPEGTSWRSFVEQQNPDLYEPREPDLRYFPDTRLRPPCATSTILLSSPSSHAQRDSSPALLGPARISPQAQTDYKQDIESALDLDDEFVPHPFGQGVCADWHFRDPVTEDPCVKATVDRYEEVRTLVAGEGMAIGRQPCEFHQNEYGF